MNVALVLGGGVALGAYHAGVYAALHERPALHPARIAGSSVGAVVGALILGNSPEKRMPVLRAFWEDAALDAPWSGAAALGGEWRRASNRLGILQVRTLGRPGFFNSRLPSALLGSDIALYDPAPLRERIARSIDFDRLNRASFSVTCTDLETGDAVVFDTRRGARITPEHLVASCGYLPDFPPLDIEGRLLGDGGLVSNTPVDRALDWSDAQGEWTIFAIDLFARASARPRRLEEAAGRRIDLLFANQTQYGLRLLEHELRARGMAERVRLTTLAYRAPSHEGGLEKPFNFARSTLTERWAAGERDMAAAIAGMGAAGTMPPGAAPNVC
jgi:NTE family protein